MHAWFVEAETLEEDRRHRQIRKLRIGCNRNIYNTLIIIAELRLVTNYDVQYLGLK